MTEEQIAMLERLTKLKEAGSLSQAEFDAEKAKILGRTDPTNASPQAKKAPARWLVVSLLVAVAAVVLMVALKTPLFDRRPEAAPSPPPQPNAKIPPPQTIAPEPQEGAKEASKAPMIHPPIITGDWNNFRTRIRNGWGTEPTFAGHYVIIRWGCGMGCTVNVVGDQNTGAIYDLGLGGEGQMILDLKFDKNSGNLKARWAESDPDLCVAQEYVWTGSRLNPVGEAVKTPRPEFNCDDPA